jgi:hypothetical protein
MRHPIGWLLVGLGFTTACASSGVSTCPVSVAVTTKVTINYVAPSGSAPGTFTVDYPVAVLSPKMSLTFALGSSITSAGSNVGEVTIDLTGSSGSGPFPQKGGDNKNTSRGFWRLHPPKEDRDDSSPADPQEGCWKYTIGGTDASGKALPALDPMIVIKN